MGQVMAIAPVAVYPSALQPACHANNDNDNDNENENRTTQNGAAPSNAPGVPPAKGELTTQ
jgi:hypothetical protein